MIGRTDLLPPSCREDFIRRKVRRRWIIAFCVGAVAIASAHSVVSLRLSGTESKRDALRARVQDRLYHNEEASNLLTEIRDIEDRLTRYNEIAWPVRMSEVLSSVGSIVPEGVTVSALTLSPRVDRVRTPARNGKPASDRTERRLVIEIQGYAVDDVTVAHIVSGFDKNPLFRTVALDFSRYRDVDEVDAREFRVQAEIDLDTRYSFADAGGGETP